MASKQDRQKKLVESKAFRKGQTFAIEFMCTAMAWVMVEEMKMEATVVQKTLDHMEDYCMDFAKRNLNLRDMQEALADEYGIRVNFGRRERNE